MWAWNFKVFTNIEPDGFDFFSCKLDQVLESEDVVRIFQGERLGHIPQLDILDVGVLVWQDEHVSVWILHMMVILDEILAYYGHSIRCL